MDSSIFFNTFYIFRVLKCERGCFEMLLHSLLGYFYKLHFWIFNFFYRYNVGVDYKYKCDLFNRENI